MIIVAQNLARRRSEFADQFLPHLRLNIFGVTYYTIRDCIQNLRSTPPYLESSSDKQNHQFDVSNPINDLTCQIHSSTKRILSPALTYIYLSKNLLYQTRSRYSFTVAVIYYGVITIISPLHYPFKVPLTSSISQVQDCRLNLKGAISPLSCPSAFTFYYLVLLFYWFRFVVGYISIQPRCLTVWVLILASITYVSTKKEGKRFIKLISQKQ